jgi:hypothetical protein
MIVHQEPDDAGVRDELPADLKGPLLRLWRIEQPIVVSILPRDAWVALGIIQFATRNPMISPTQRQLIESFGRELQRGLAQIDPSVEKYLEMGWNPEFDR